jgi:hypothetical protein
MNTVSPSAGIFSGDDKIVARGISIISQAVGGYLLIVLGIEQIPNSSSGLVSITVPFPLAITIFNSYPIRMSPVKGKRVN